MRLKNNLLWVLLQAITCQAIRMFALNTQLQQAFPLFKSSQVKQASRAPRQLSAVLIYLLTHNYNPTVKVKL